MWQHVLCCPIEICVLLNLLCVCTCLSSSPSPSVTAWCCLFCGDWLHPPLSLSLTPSFCPPPHWLHDVSLGQRFMFCSICEEAQNLTTLLQCLLQLSGVDGPSDVPKIDLCAWMLEQLSVLKKNWILWWLSETVPQWALSFASHSCILTNFHSGCHVALNK